MKQLLIDGITRGKPLDDEIFLAIIETSDVLERAQFIEQIRRKCQEINRLREFNNLLKAWLQKHAQTLKQASSNKTQFTDAPLVLNCGKYQATDTGVVLNDITQTGMPITSVACPHPILPTERLINIDTGTEKVKVSYFRDKQWRDVTVPCETIYNRNQVSSLADRGVLVTSETGKDLVRYLSEVISLNAEEIPLYRSIGRIGWVGDGFAPYVDDVKYDGDTDFRSIYEHVRECGSYQVWLDHVGDLRRDINVRMMLAASFASPLIEVVGALPFVLHLWGTTGFGKTVSLMVASSVWGNPEMGCLTRTMNMTANAMARTASFLRNIPFCADELQQIKTNWTTYDNLIMYLTEGIDRGRAKARGGVEDVQIWRNSFIFTGEEPITKGVSGGGAKNRVIEIECEDKIIDDGNFTANLVKANYGHAGKAFIAHLRAYLDQDREKVLTEYKRLFTGVLVASGTTDKQALYMALLLLADKLSCECIFGGEPLTIEQVLPFVRSVDDVRVENRAFDEVISLIVQNKNKFYPDAFEIWGKIDADNGCVHINKQVLVREMAKMGFDFDAVKKDWAKTGKLIRNASGRYVHQTSINHIRSGYIKLSIDDDEPTTYDDAVQAEMPF